MTKVKSILSGRQLIAIAFLCPWVLIAQTDSTPPSAPPNLAAILVQGTRVELTWSAAFDNVGVTEYRVYRDGSPIGTSPTTSYVDTTGYPFTIYEYTVVACDAVGNVSAVSTPAEVLLGQVYYVAPSGHDGNTGTLSAPWATLAKAAATMVGGDLVYVRAGTYMLAATIQPRSGSSDRPITYAGFPGETATIHGGDGSIMSFSGRSYLILDGLHFTTSSTRVGASMFYLESSGSISFLNCEFFGMPAANGSENSAVIRCMRSSGFSSDCTFRNNYFRDNRSPAIRTYTTDGWIIENNTFEDCLEAIGGKDAPNNMIVRRNLIVGADIAFYFAGQGGAHNVTITENIVINTRTGFLIGGLGTGGNLRESVYLFNNTFFNVGNFVKGWDDGYTTNQNYYNNVFYATLTSDRGGGSDSAGRFICINRWGSALIDVGDYVMDYNLLQIPDNDPSDRFVVGGQKFQTLASWRVAFPEFDVHSISGDPQFVDVDAGDFHLLPFSPCKGTGLNGVDMGAYPRGNDGTIIGVIRSHHPPVLAPIGNRSVPAGQPLQITVEATDADGDALQYSATGGVL